MEAGREPIRVFTERTSYTPDDDYAFVGRPPLVRPPAEEVHVSCVFTWKKSIAEDLARDWGQYYSVVKIGGPAYDDAGDEFTPGMYIKQGEVITSRGCPNKCSYCFVPKREGCLRLLQIKEGWDILDNNLLACPRSHIEAVLAMLAKQNRKIMFRGGLEARRLEPWFADAICEIGVSQLFLAYNGPPDKESVADIINLLKARGCTRHNIFCYVLVGFKADTQQKATERLQWVVDQGGSPFAMYYRDKNSEGNVPVEWRCFVRLWNRPGAIFSRHHKAMLAGEARQGQQTLFE